MNGNMEKKNLLNLPLYFSLVIFIISLFCYSMLVVHFPLLWMKQDLIVYYTAGKYALAGKNIYTFGSTFADFIYPSFTALFFAILALFPFVISKWVITLGSLGALLVSCVIVLRFAGYKRRETLWSQTLFFSAILLWLEPVMQTLEYGQINLILMALILLGFYYRKIPLCSGILFGLAAGIKLTPLIFIPYLFLIGCKKTSGIALLIMLVTIIISFIFLPASSWMYWTTLLSQTDRIGGMSLIGNQSLYAMLNRSLGNSFLPYWYLSEALVGISGLWIAIYIYKRKYALLSLLLCAITGLLISPVSWSHHWVWIAPLLLYLFFVIYRTKNIFGWIAFSAVFILFCWLTPIIPNLSSMHHILLINIPVLHQVSFLQENAYVLFGLLCLLLVMLFVIVR